MHICSFCAFLNGMSTWKPKIENYYNENYEVPHGFKHIDGSGCSLTNDYKAYPREDSDLFDKTEMEIIDINVKKELSFLINNIVCDICMFRHLYEGSIKVHKQLDENEKMFRIYMRGLKDNMT